MDEEFGSLCSNCPSTINLARWLSAGMSASAQVCRRTCPERHALQASNFTRAGIIVVKISSSPNVLVTVW
jgi:hypothetical protein